MSKKKTNEAFDKIPEQEVKEPKKKDKIQALLDEIKDKYGLNVELGKNVKYKTEKIINYINNKYDFRYNLINTDTEYRLKENEEFLHFDDRDYRDLFVDLKLSNINASDQDFKSIVYGRSVSREFHPFKDYFNSLPKWDGKRDYIREYCQQVQLTDENNRKYFVEGFRKWFTALVVGLLTEEPTLYNINQTCLVLVGPQGKYKTTWVKNIVPKHLQLKYFYGGTFQFHNKDHEKYLAYKILINLDEMAALNKADLESVKSKITQDQVVVRLPYAKADIHLKRRASFTATQNNVEWLRDDTGSRRWLIVEVENIDLRDDFDVDAMYAQGLQYFKEGMRYWFNTEDIMELERQNEKFQLKSFEFELVQKHYQIPEEQELQGDNMFIKYVTATDIANDLAGTYNKLNVNNTVVKNIGSALKKLGFYKKSRRVPGSKSPVPMWVIKEVLTPGKTVSLEDIESNNDII